MPIDPDSDEVALPPLPEHEDPRWICWKCGGLALLDDNGLCRYCWPEQVLTFQEVCSRAHHGGGLQVDKRWRIG